MRNTLLGRLFGLGLKSPEHKINKNEWLKELIKEPKVLNKPLTLGYLGRDKITGFTGILSAKVEYLTGCNQWCLNPKCDEKGDTRRPEYFDEGRIEIIGLGVLPEDVILDSKNPGGPNRDCPSC